MALARPNGFTAYGVDGCRGGWLVVALGPDGSVDWFVCASIEEVVAGAGESDRVFIDIPIGLPSDARERKCDVAARATLKAPRASSVFRVPVRGVFVARDYHHAGDINAAATGKRVARQTWAIVPKIAEVDSLLRRCAKARRVVREIHPEVCFWALAGKAMRYRKRTACGFEERLVTLARFWPAVREVVDGVLGDTRRKDVARDDIVDAAVAALVAARPDSELECLPYRPEMDEFDLPMAMVFARAANEDESGRAAGAKPTVSDRDVVKRVELAKDLARWLHGRVTGQKMPGDDRHRAAGALLQQSEDIADGTILLLENRLPGPALALARPLFESYVRGVWALHCADDDAVARFIESGRPTPWKLKDLIDALRADVPKVGGVGSRAGTTRSSVQRSDARRATPCVWAHHTDDDRAPLRKPRPNDTGRPRNRAAHSDCCGTAHRAQRRRRNGRVGRGRDASRSAGWGRGHPCGLRFVVELCKREADPHQLADLRPSHIDDRRPGDRSVLVARERTGKGPAGGHLDARSRPVFLWPDMLNFCPIGDEIPHDGFRTNEYMVREVLAEVGYSSDEITDLRARNIGR